jgi:hypothetical protein
MEKFNVVARSVKDLFDRLQILMDNHRFDLTGGPIGKELKKKFQPEIEKVEHAGGEISEGVYEVGHKGKGVVTSFRVTNDNATDQSTNGHSRRG